MAGLIDLDTRSAVDHPLGTQGLAHEGSAGPGPPKPSWWLPADATPAEDEAAWTKGTGGTPESEVFLEELEAR